MNFKYMPNETAVVEYGKDGPKAVYIVRSQQEVNRLKAIIGTGNYDLLVPLISVDEGSDTVNIVGPGRSR